MALFSLGANGSGQLGLGHCEDMDRPQKVALPLEFTGSPKALVCGGNHALILDSVGQLFVCGSNGKDRLFLPPSTPQIETFLKLQNEAEGIVGIGAGFEHSCYITRERIFSQGSNSFRQLGCPTSTNAYQLCFGDTLAAVGCGPRTTCIVTELGLVWAWGKGEPPIKLDVPSAAKVSQGFHHTVILTKEGHVYTCGKNTFGQRGTAEQAAVTQVVGITGVVVDIQAGWHHCLALTECGSIWGWGRNDHGQLSDDRAPVPLPRLIPLPGRVTQIACGAEHSVALTDSSAVFAWGWNEHGNCGQSSLSEPLRLPEKPVQIAAGYGFTLIWCHSQSSEAAPVVSS